MRADEPFGKAVYELFSSMRFAITLLTLLAIASIIGTVLKQAEPYNNYIIQFGPYWFEVFRLLGLYDVYHASWFLLILTFLVASTSLCIYRNAPGMVKEMRNFREHVTEQSLAAFSHQRIVEHSQDTQALAAKVAAYLVGQGYRSKTLARENGVLVAAKRGAASRAGYLLAHSAIVLICIGGLLDGNLVFKFQQLMGTKQIETRDIPQSQVPAISRLTPDNPSFRGSVQIPEGSTANVVFLNVADGYLVQDLPFVVQLKKFRIEHYSTGQPKLFESDLVLLDRQGKKIREATIAVNKPLIHDGVAIYQASFGDGGSRLKIRGWNLFAPAVDSFSVQGAVHETARISAGAEEYQLEFTDFRLFNIENFGGEMPRQNAMSVKSDTKSLRNAGPSYQVKVRNPRGEAREYHNYMMPVAIDGRSYLLSGMRETPSEPFRFLRIPVDAQGKIDTFMRLRGTLMDPALRGEIAARFAAGALAPGERGGETHARLEVSARNILELFAQRGYSSLGQFIETRIPEHEQQKASETFIRILELAGFEALKIANAQAGQPAPLPDEATGRFVSDSLNAFNDLFFYGAPVYLQLETFEQVQASGLQMTRSPGKNLVYLGSLLLVLGIFAMLYVRERRAWIFVKPGIALFAYATPRKTVDFEQEFAKHSQAIEQLAKD
jgi:cytochrome c biogenesis protein